MTKIVWKMQAIFAYIINGTDIPEKVAGVRHIFNKHLRGWGQACVIENFFSGAAVFYAFD
jgi:hypothetical protein